MSKGVLADKHFIQLLLRTSKSVLAKLFIHLIKMLASMFLNQ